MDDQAQYQVAIVGGGLAGLTMACFMGQAGVKAACIDIGSTDLARGTDLRTTAISFGSQQILEQAGIWQNLPESPCPINDIQIFDGSSPLLLNFLSGEAGGKAFGWIVNNVDLRLAMIETLSQFKTVIHLSSTIVKDYTASLNYVKLKIEGKQGKAQEKKGFDHGAGEPATQSSEELTAQLVIGADGRGSFTRRWMGVKTRGWSYEQRAVICMARHEHPHNNIAVEHFFPQGPFAVLPMADGSEGEHRSSVVFTEHGPESKSLMHLSDKAFELALAAKFPARYGDIKLMHKRAAYPLNLVHAAEYIAPRMALVADAAHGIHPIAGQGLNLGFRDVKVMADLVNKAHEGGGDVGDMALLETYQRIRRPDNMSMIAVTDGLNRLFSNNIMPIRVLRKAGLRAVSKLPMAKRFFMRQAMGDRA